MKIDLEPGTYVVAVSGGVDSMTLLHMLMQQKSKAQSPKSKGSGYKFIVAHFDHGIRYDSEQDRKLVQEAAKNYGLRFVYDEGNLGNVSEAAARKARYEFLHQIRQASQARAIVTAHHQDDLLETAVLNLLRGTGRRGLTSLKSSDVIKRPLIDIPKQELINYAQQNGLIWREDPSNQDLKYIRNYIRHKILPRFSAHQKQMLLGIIKSLHETNEEIDRHLTTHLHIQPATDKLDRHYFIMLPHKVAREVMYTWLRRHHVKEVTSKTLERLVTAAKTYKLGQEADIDVTYKLKVDKKYLQLARR